MLIIALLFVANLSFANTSGMESLLAKGHQQYDEGLYNEAIETYQSILDKNFESAQLYYNLGNAYFKINDLASAILYYEKAKKISPNDEDIMYNLGVANSRIVDKIENVPQIIFKRWWNQFYNTFSANSWAKVAIVLFIITLILTGVYLLSRNRFIKKSFFVLGLIFLLLSASSFFVSYQKYYYTKNHKEAILFASTLTVKSSPNRNSVDLFVIHEGTKVYILDQVGEWVEIRIANGSVGWLPVNEIKLI